MSSNLCYARAETPTPGQSWSSMPEDERIALVNTTLRTKTAFSDKVLIAVEAKQDGQVIIRLHDSLSADKRGTLLLDMEDFLKKCIDSGLVVWLEPFGDRSSLRNLRGIEVKS